MVYHLGCFALKKNGECRALNSHRNCGELCVFFKTTEQQNEGIRRAYLRLSTLPTEQQLYIADTYYKGSMPWRKEVEVMK